VSPSDLSPEQSSGGERAPARAGARLVALLPVVAFLALAAVLWRQLAHGGDPSVVPSPLIGRSVPHFSLPPLKGVPSAGFSTADLRSGHVTLVNVFASWCVPCREERPLLLQLAHDPKLKSQGLRIAGIAYKDEPANSRAFLADGDPYAMIGVDRSGRASIDWGVYGVPETYIVSRAGKIVYKLIGAITPENLVADVKPQIAKAER